MSLAQPILSIVSRFLSPAIAHAHCDLPCGIYDPHQAQIAALTIIRMIDIMQELESTHTGHHDEEFRNSMIRCVIIKEDHGRILKHEIATIWGDYFKPEHIEKYPEIHELVHKIMQLASKGKQTVSRTQGEELLEAVNQFAEIFWKTKNIATKRAKSPHKPEMEIVYPNL
jgi:nickel superoxide dismutase